MRVGGTVHRPMGSGADFIRQLLVHLEECGFTGAPRYRGIDPEGRMVVDYVEGWVPHEELDWSAEQLKAVTRLVREFHDQTASSTLAGNAEIVCHNDLAPWNTVLRDGRPVAFIDFDDAAPGQRLDDVGYLAWTFLRLGREAPVREQAAHIRLIVGEYGLPTGGVLEAIARQQARVLAYRERSARLDQDSARSDYHRDRAAAVRAEMGWMTAHQSALRELVDA